MRNTFAAIAACLGLSVPVGAALAGAAHALPCTPCRVFPPGPRPVVMSNDFASVNVIGGIKAVTWGFERVPRWDPIRSILSSDAFDRDPRLVPWIAWAAALRSQAASERLNAINSRVNQRVRYQTDQQIHGRPDHWQPPVETVTRGVGDCEDYAILKFYLALKAGIPLDDLTIVVGRVLSTGEAHAVFVARSERGWRLYDNRTSIVTDLGGRADMNAVYFVDLTDLWIPRPR
jgi:predicted transglutaminase-like cysteine proteinase